MYLKCGTVCIYSCARHRNDMTLPWQRRGSALCPFAFRSLVHGLCVDVCVFFGVILNICCHGLSFSFSGYSFVDNYVFLGFLETLQLSARR